MASGSESDLEAVSVNINWKLKHPAHQFFKYDSKTDKSVCTIPKCPGKRPIQGKDPTNLVNHLAFCHKIGNSSKYAQYLELKKVYDNAKASKKRVQQFEQTTKNW